MNPQAPWPGVLGGGRHPPCLQPDLQGGVLGSEDCLTLTIYSPHEAADPLLPVMVWLPGGGFVVGGASEQDWNPEFFLDKVTHCEVQWSTLLHPRVWCLQWSSTAWDP